MRWGEIRTLKCDQIKDGWINLSKTKSGKPRQIPIAAYLYEVLQILRKRNHLRSEYVFLYRGKPIKSVKTAFKNALKEANIEDCRFHDLRHTFASHFLMKGGDLKTLMELLGHAKIEMPLRYSHLAESHKEKSIARLNGLCSISKNTIW